MTWSNLKDKFEIDDIGARLLANLAKGIYSAEAVLREYVQNAADAYEELQNSGVSTTEPPNIVISLEGLRSVSIHDNGIGMNAKAIREAKKIAVSPKAGANLTGFRGIGIWAGFQACEKLEVVTTRKGNPNRYRLTIDFKEILKHVDDDINIKELLDNRFRLEEDKEDVEAHYTHVTLRGLLPEYEQLLNSEELVRIVAQNLPCRISPDFKHKGALEKFLLKVDSYQEYPILVGKDEVYRHFPAGIDAPETAVLKEGPVELARVWWCAGSSALDTAGTQQRSFRLRVRNFAVGRVGIYDDEDGSPYGALAKQLKTRNRLLWFVGEIHVTNDKIVPDTPRNNLELDPLSRTAIEKIRAFYGERISEAGALSELNSAKAELERAKDLLQATDITVDGAQRALEKLQAQEKRILGKPPSDDTKKRVRQLLGTKEIKAERKQLLKQLQGWLDKQSAGSKTPQATPNPKPTTQKNPTAPPPKPGTAGFNVQGASAVDFERLLSDILAIISDKLDDEEAITEISAGLQDLFEKAQLLPNSK